jgi:hypothetical protein
MSKIFDRTTAPGANDDASPLPDILGSQYTAMCRWAGVEDAYSGSLNFIFSSAAEPKNPKVAAFPTSRTEPRQDTVSNDSPRLVGPLPRPAIPSEEYVASARPPEQRVSSLRRSCGAAEPKNPKVAAFPTSRTEPRQDTVSNDSPRLVGPLPRPAIPSEEYVASARPPGCTFQYHNRFAFTLTFFFTSHSSHSHSHSLSPSFASTFAFALTPAFALAFPLFAKHPPPL